MILIKDPFGVAEMERVGRLLGPRQAYKPVNIGAHDPRFGRTGRDHRQPVDLSCSSFADCIRHSGLDNSLTQALDLRLLGIAITKFPVDGLDLFAEEIFPLRFLHALVDLALDLVLEIDDVQVMRKEPRNGTQAVCGIGNLEQLLALRNRQVGCKRRNIRQPAGFLSASRRREDFRMARTTLLDELLELVHHRPHQRLGGKRAGIAF